MTHRMFHFATAGFLIVVTFASLIGLLALTSCVTRAEIGPHTREHALHVCAVANLCRAEPACAALTHADGTPHLEILDQACENAEIVDATVRGERVAEP